MIKEFSMVLQVKQNQSEERIKSFTNFRLIALGHYQVCSRCCGTGNYSYNMIDGTICYKCNGSGKQPIRLTKKLLEVVKNQVANNELQPYFEEVRRKKIVKNAINEGLKLLLTKYENPYHWQSEEPEAVRLRELQHKICVEYEKIETITNAIREAKLKNSKNRESEVNELSAELARVAPEALNKMKEYRKEL